MKEKPRPPPQPVNERKRSRDCSFALAGSIEPMALKERPSVQPRLRLVHRGEIALGPGKADLLDALARTGSLAQAAREMEMSYMRAWSLVRTMNAAFRRPLVTTRRGGQGRGGAALTPT